VEGGRGEEELEGGRGEEVREGEGRMLSTYTSYIDLHCWRSCYDIHVL